MSKLKFIGGRELAGVNVELWAEVGEPYGGRVNTTPPKGSPPRITVGVVHNNFETVMGTLLHEVLECYMMLRGNRYQKTSDTETDVSAMLFVLTHPEFTQATVDAAWFIHPLTEKLHRAFKKANRKKK